MSGSLHKSLLLHWSYALHKLHWCIKECRWNLKHKVYLMFDCLFIHKLYLMSSFMYLTSSYINFTWYLRSFLCMSYTSCYYASTILHACYGFLTSTKLDVDISCCTSTIPHVYFRFLHQLYLMSGLFFRHGVYLMLIWLFEHQLYFMLNFTLLHQLYLMPNHDFRHELYLIFSCEININEAYV